MLTLPVRAERRTLARDPLFEVHPAMMDGSLGQSQNALRLELAYMLSGPGPGHWPGRGASGG